MIFGPVVGTVPHWFKKKLGVALGLMAVGSSIGGCVFPIAVQNLIERVGYVPLLPVPPDFSTFMLMHICLASHGRCA